MLSPRLVIAVFVLLMPFSNLRGERVGYRFTGDFQGSSTQTYSLFGETVPRNSHVTGTFSYDTTAASADGEPGERIYHQLIRGGYTLDIDSGAIQLSASDYYISMADNFDLPPSDLFRIDYNFDSARGVTPEPILEHGTPWTGTRGFITISLFWDSTTFSDPDEPKLTVDRPATPSATIVAIVGSNPIITARMFTVTSITQIVPAAGDYNIDGKLDTNDYSEWRKAFGKSQPKYSYADGNNNGVVDAADYVIWRKSLVPGTALEVVPEPSSMMMIITWLVLLIRSPKQWLCGERQL